MLKRYRRGRGELKIILTVFVRYAFSWFGRQRHARYTVMNSIRFSAQIPTLIAEKAWTLGNTRPDNAVKLLFIILLTLYL